MWKICIKQFIDRNKLGSGMTEGLSVKLWIEFQVLECKIYG